MNKKAVKFLESAMLTVLLAAIPITTLAQGVGNCDVKSTRQLSKGVVFEKSVATDGEKTRNINKITLSYKDSDYMFMPYYGDDLQSRHTLTEMASLAEKDGYEVLAAINGDFYYIENGKSSGMPKGPVIQNDSVICTEDFPPNISAISSQDWQTIGFKRDGTAVTGHFTTDRTITMQQQDGTTTEENFTVMNRQLLEMGIHVYTTAFGEKISNSVGIYAAVLSVEKGNFALSQTVVCRVKEIIENSKSIDLKSGEVVVCAPRTFLNDKNVAIMKTMFEGQRIDLQIAPQNEAWKGVFQALSGPNSVVSNGQVTTSVSAIPLNYPSSLAGITESGDLILTQIDGRNMGGSYGIGTIGAGEYMKSLGCVNAMLFDGGGSSEIVVKDSGEFKVENLPSDGNERAVGTCLLIVKKTDTYSNLAEIYEVPEYKADFWYKYGKLVIVLSLIAVVSLITILGFFIFRRCKKRGNMLY